MCADGIHFDLMHPINYYISNRHKILSLSSLVAFRCHVIIMVIFRYRRLSSSPALRTRLSAGKRVGRRVPPHPHTDSQSEPNPPTHTHYIGEIV